MPSYSPPTRVLLLISAIWISLFGCSTRSFNYSFGAEERAIGVSAGFFDPLAPLYPDTDIAAGQRAFVTDIPRNAAGSVVVLVETSDPGEVFSIELSSGTIGNISFYELQDIPVLKNTGFFGMTEKKLGFENRNIIRHAPFSVYEVLMPSKVGRFTGKRRYAFYLKLRISDVEERERIKTDVLIRNENGTTAESLTWILNVHPVTLSEGEGAELYYTNWFRGPQEGFSERYDEEWWQLMGEHLTFMREGGQNVAKIPQTVVFDSVNSQWILNEERLERFLSLCEDNGFFLFEGPRPAARKSSFLKRGVVIKPGRWDTGTREAATFIQNTYQPLYQFLVKRGSTEKWVQHVLDEPMSKHAKDYQWVAAEMRRAMPGIRIIDAVRSREPLVGAVNVWSPLVSEYQKNRDFFVERQKMGEEVWIYSCMVPGGSWLNRTMDQERLRSVYVGWGTALFGVTGYLRWDLDSWRGNQNIWEGELSGSEDDLVRRPFGDGFVTFPGENGRLLSTTRWEAGRIGMEDYRLLMLLKKVDEEAFERIVSICFTDFKTYETDSRIYRRARRELLEILSERLSPIRH